VKKTGLLLAVMILILCGCEKGRNKPIDHSPIIAGGLYYDYTEVMQNDFVTEVNISDSIYHFNRVAAQFCSHHPTSNQNVFYLSYLDANSGEKSVIEFMIFVPFTEPSAFFTNGTIVIDSMVVTYSGISDNFYDAGALFTWETSDFQNISFTGNGKLEILNKLESKLQPGVYLPPQEISFSFD
jgi:hypothetical protein